MERKVALITGITGQDGSYLAEFLIDKGYEVHGLLRRSSSFNTGRIEHLYLDEWVRDMKKQRLVNLHWADMTDSSSLIRIIAEVKPTEIYNLAAQSHVKVSTPPTPMLWVCYVCSKPFGSVGSTRPAESIKHRHPNSTEKCKKFRSAKQLLSIHALPMPWPSSMDSGL